jgi:hypothetical protein
MERQAEVEHRVAVPRCSSLAGPRLTFSYLATLHQHVAQVVEQHADQGASGLLSSSARPPDLEQAAISPPDKSRTSPL